MPSQKASAPRVGRAGLHVGVVGTFEQSQVLVHAADH